MMRAKVLTVMRRHVQDEVNQEDSEQNEVDGMKKGADSTGKVMHCLLYTSDACRRIERCRSRWSPYH